MYSDSTVKVKPIYNCWKLEMLSELQWNFGSVAQFSIAIKKHQLNCKEEGRRTKKKNGLYQR